MHDPAFVSAALQRAMDALGWVTLSSRLNSPPSLIHDWMNRHATMPDRKVIALLDLLGEIEDEPGRNDSES